MHAHATVAVTSAYSSYSSFSCSVHPPLQLLSALNRLGVPLNAEEQHLLQSTHADMAAFQAHTEAPVGNDAANALAQNCAGMQLSHQPPPQGLFGAPPAPAPAPATPGGLFG
jgi:hypothetical protein